MPPRRLLGAVAAAGLVAVAPGAAAAAVTERVSVDSAGGQANESSFAHGISADGRYVAFTSFASNLVPGDTNGDLNPFSGIDVFVHDRVLARTERVTVSSSGAQANGSSLSTTLSSDGRFVAFQSSASNLVAGDTNASADVFVHDRLAHTTERVSLTAAGAQASGDSFTPGISADGRYVAFTSTAPGLVPGDLGPGVYLRDRQTGTTERVDRSSGGVPGNGFGEFPSVSADGRYVAFSSAADNLVPGDANGQIDILVRDRQAGSTTRVSVGPGGIEGDGRSGCWYMALSADGRFVTFQSHASNLVAGDTNQQADVFVHDRQTATTERVSVSSAEEQALGGPSQLPTISPDGRFVAFNTLASNLVPGDTAVVNNSVLRDRQAGTTEAVDVSSSGEPARGGASGTGFVSAGGRFVAFDSLASNLVPGDTNGHTDVFVRDRGPASPTDAIRDLIALVERLGLPHGIARSLTVKLRKALVAAADGDPATRPCGHLRAFRNQVRAQAGKKLSHAQAARLIGDAGAIGRALGCGG